MKKGLNKRETSDLEKISKEQKINFDLLKIEYLCARNNGQPKHEDAMNYIKNRVIVNLENQYKILKGNNIKYKF